MSRCDSFAGTFGLAVPTLGSHPGVTATPNVARAVNGDFQTPLLDVHFGFIEHDGEVYGFPYTCLGGTSVPIDLAEAVKVAIDPDTYTWITLGFFFAPRHPVINPHGGGNNVVFNSPLGIGDKVLHVTYGKREGSVASSPIDPEFVLRDALDRAVGYVRAGRDIKQWLPAGVFIIIYECPQETREYDGLEDIESMHYVSGKDGTVE
ncbi:hypothetical protein C8A00DRAFT_38131 [Chaetomidium leptoderma]|uniref:Uncharacterized protein n=1 Tax=Chaetomidium leptoderma TaxID=669021 RepID=A0AAN6VEX5_9PEZI|nr:hypothetical protein C8A00DRAFT_38131 [Chaetomidium leptoderma]